MKLPKPVHPFPARMAPEIVLKECSRLPKDALVLDPMCGSGTTLRVAMENGISAIGSDLDPLAVLISKVNTTHIESYKCMRAAEAVVKDASILLLRETRLPWIDDNRETQEFIRFWFGNKQSADLRKLVTIIYRDHSGEMLDFLKIAVSRIIITKESRASLARDTSHSRPHKVTLDNNFEVFPNFLKSAHILASRLPSKGLPNPDVAIADSRNLLDIPSSYIDRVITSPPYLNAIDYMRGNKLALVWLGYRVSELRQIRSTSIGSERQIDKDKRAESLNSIIHELGFYKKLKNKEKFMFERYVNDIYLLMSEIHRVIKPSGVAILVVGNSYLKGVFIKNTLAVIEAARIAGLELKLSKDRRLPANKRYLPITSLPQDSSLGKRMRTESVLTFAKT